MLVALFIDFVVLRKQGAHARHPSRRPPSGRWSGSACRFAFIGWLCWCGGAGRTTAARAGQRQGAGVPDRLPDREERWRSTTSSSS
ncbi:MAG: hypothetical protein MZW92_36830 [Comamonadaceae bacterium]|nr:hypothetical protein [Comamonadaceae bacterium]